MFHAWAFDDIMIFQFLKIQNLIISRMKRAFEVKWKTFVLVSKVHSIKRTKQTSKNVVDKTFTDSLQEAKKWEKNELKK